uniref:Uncharacterized protein n=1 Tax=Ditylenchus dipsaci TaxID=166011 RepID=A0A915D837_9BILA
MRPKYGPVSFDVIDAVNARLAAASNSKTTTVKVESIENEAKVPGGIRSSAPPEGERAVSSATGVAKTGSMTALQQKSLGNEGMQIKQAPGTPSTDHKNSKSITLSIGKRYQNGSKRHTTVPGGGGSSSVNPIAATSVNANPTYFPASPLIQKNVTQEQELLGGDSLKKSSSATKWQDSFDKSEDRQSPSIPFEKSFEYDCANRKSPMPPIRYGLHAKILSPSYYPQLRPVQFPPCPDNTVQIMSTKSNPATVAPMKTAIPVF